MNEKLNNEEESLVKTLEDMKDLAEVGMEWDRMRALEVAIAAIKNTVKEVNVITPLEEKIITEGGGDKKVVEDRTEHITQQAHVVQERFEQEIEEVKNSEDTSLTVENQVEKGELSEKEKMRRLFSIPEIEAKFMWESEKGSDAILKEIKGDFSMSKFYPKAVAVLAQESFVEPVIELPKEKGESLEDKEKTRKYFENNAKIELLLKNVPYVRAIYDKRSDTPESILSYFEDAATNPSSTPESRAEKAEVLADIKRVLGIS